jgi:hypothetical protein
MKEEDIKKHYSIQLLVNLIIAFSFTCLGAFTIIETHWSLKLFMAFVGSIFLYFFKEKGK